MMEREVGVEVSCTFGLSPHPKIAKPGGAQLAVWAMCLDLGLVFWLFKKKSLTNNKKTRSLGDLGNLASALIQRQKYGLGIFFGSTFPVAMETTHFHGTMIKTLRLISDD